jgi:hypothetical protein
MICSNMLDRSPTPPADAAPQDHFAWTQTLLIRQVERLEELSISALRLAQAIERQATAEPSGLAEDAAAKAGAEAPGAPVSLDAAALSFSRVARAMHTTALLQLRLIEDMGKARDRHETRAEADHDAAIQERLKDPDWEHKMRVEGIVARVAKPKLGDDDDALNRLMAEAHDRLDDDDIYGDVITRPVGELVALVCRDLGLDPDWPSLAEEAWAREEIESGPPPGSPFQNLERQRPPSFAAANGGGGPPAEERGVVGAGLAHPPFDHPS